MRDSCTSEEVPYPARRLRSFWSAACLEGGPVNRFEHIAPRHELVLFFIVRNARAIQQRCHAAEDEDKEVLNRDADQFLCLRPFH